MATTTADANESVQALTDRARELLASHDLAGAIARLVVELKTAPAPALMNAQAAGISRRTWRRLVASGELKASLIGRELFATREDVARLIASKAVERAEVQRRRPRRSGQSADIDILIASGAAKEQRRNA